VPAGAEASGPVGPAPPPQAHLESAPPRSLVQRYAEMSHAYERRPADAVLRGFDLLIAGAILLVLSPLVLLIALLIGISSGRPILYRGARVGRFGRIFTMYKFRTLVADAELRLGPYYGEELTVRTRAETIPLGSALRALHSDEIPQLLNVLRGEMSIVGPRPIRPAFFEELCERVPQYWQRLVVRPGVTGFAQTRITREEDWAFKLAHDLEYIADRSVSLYMRVLLATMGRVISRAVRGIADHLGRRERA
jgi:lipopolysaccharide/colanic/teichoic acid biosynthesis glycosyltransferase